jgi:hypothetical protein
LAPWGSQLTWPLGHWAGCTTVGPISQPFEVGQTRSRGQSCRARRELSNEPLSESIRVHLGRFRVCQRGGRGPNLANFGIFEKSKRGKASMASCGPNEPPQRVCRHGNFVGLEHKNPTDLRVFGTFLRFSPPSRGLLHMGPSQPHSPSKNAHSRPSPPIIKLPPMGKIFAPKGEKPLPLTIYTYDHPVFSHGRVLLTMGNTHIPSPPQS